MFIGSACFAEYHFELYPDFRLFNNRNINTCYKNY